VSCSKDREERKGKRIREVDEEGEPSGAPLTTKNFPRLKDWDWRVTSGSLPAREKASQNYNQRKEGGIPWQVGQKETIRYKKSGV